MRFSVLENTPQYELDELSERLLLREELGRLTFFNNPENQKFFALLEQPKVSVAEFVDFINAVTFWARYFLNKKPWARNDVSN